MDYESFTRTTNFPEIRSFYALHFYFQDRKPDIYDLWSGGPFIVDYNVTMLTRAYNHWLHRTVRFL